MKENMLITGGSGLLALNWGQISRDDYNVNLVLHNRKIQLARTSTSCFRLNSIEEIQTQFEKLKPKIVIHTASLTSVEECESNPELAHHVNVELAENVAKVCAMLNIKFVHISTDHLFSGNELNVNEEHLITPQNVYAKTKAEAELRVLDIYPESLIIRTNFYGFGASYRKSFSDMIINSLKKNENITLFKDVFYTPIFTSVLIKTVHELIKLNTAGIFNVVGDERLSKYEFGMKIAKKFELDETLINKGSVHENPNLIHRPSDMSLSNIKVCDLLGRTLGNVDEHVGMLYQQHKTGLAQEIQSL